MEHKYKVGRKRLVTAEQLLHMKAKLDYQWYELDRGKPVLCEPGGFEHTDAGTQLVIELGVFVKTHQLGRVLGDGGTYVLERNPDTVRIPDVSFIRAGRVPYGLKSFIDGAPDLAVEIMSPSDRFIGLERKADQYIKAGTSLVWTIRPIDRTAVVRRADGSVEKVSADGVLDGEGVVPGFKCRLGVLFER